MGNNERHQTQDICERIPPFTDRQKDVLDGKVEMTYELFLECLEVCAQAEDVNKYFEIWDKYPEIIEELSFRGLISLNKSKAKDSWEKFKAMMREEYGEDFI